MVVDGRRRRIDPSLHELRLLGIYLEAHRVSVLSAVDAARTMGATWQEIGTALGVSKQAAQQRFGGKGNTPDRGPGHSTIPFPPTEKNQR